MPLPGLEPGCRHPSHRAAPSPFGAEQRRPGRVRAVAMRAAPDPVLRVFHPQPAAERLRRAFAQAERTQAIDGLMLATSRVHRQQPVSSRIQASSASYLSLPTVANRLASQFEPALPAGFEPATSALRGRRPKPTRPRELRVGTWTVSYRPPPALFPRPPPWYSGPVCAALVRAYTTVPERVVGGCESPSTTLEVLTGIEPAPYPE